MLTAPSVRPPVQIVLQSGERLQGKLAEVTATGLTVTRRGSDTVLHHGDIRQLRITHRTKQNKHRSLFGIGGFLGVAAATGAAGEYIQVHPLLPIGVLAAMIGIPIYFCKLGARRSRGGCHRIGFCRPGARFTKHPVTPQWTRDRLIASRQRRRKDSPRGNSPAGANVEDTGAAVQSRLSPQCRSGMPSVRFRRARSACAGRPGPAPTPERLAGG